MLGIFKKGKSKQSLLHPVWQRWAAAIDKRQRRWANCLNQQVERYSKRSKQILLAIFCILFGSSSTYIIVRAIENPSGRVSIEKMSFPAYATGTDTTSTFQPTPVLTESQYRNIQRFKKYMDNLQTTTAGKIKYDSIIKARPGLIDSIVFIEQIYRQQVKTK
ncbi:MAG: hypothetical protein QM768_12555 [Agriterribacter sp.]